MDRRIALLGLVSLALLIAPSTGAFSAMSADRGVDVSVVDDSNAYMAINNDAPLQCGNSSANTLFQNQFASPLENIEVRVSVPEDATSDIRVSKTGQNQKVTLEPGDSTTLEFGTGGTDYNPGTGPVLKIKPVNGETPEYIMVEIVEATAPGILVTVDQRRFDVHCTKGGTETNEQGAPTEQSSNDNKSDSDTAESGGAD